MAARETDNPQIRLASSGQMAVIEADKWVPGSYQLVVDGTPQSHVNLDDPTNLFFEYIQRIGHVIGEEGGQQVRMTLEHLPQDRQDALVRHKRLPGRLQEQAARALDVAAREILVADAE